MSLLKMFFSIFSINNSNKFFLLLIVFFSSTFSFAEEGKKPSSITTENVFLLQTNNKYSLSGDVLVTLEETLIDALAKGVTLEFISDLQLLSDRLIFPDKVEKNWTRKASLTYHGITRRYYVRIEEKKLFFESLTQALASCLGLKNWINLKKIEIKKRNRLRVKLSLNIDSLPKPLSLVAVSDPAWKLTTGWVPVEIKE